MKPVISCCVRDAAVRRNVHEAAAMSGATATDVDLPLQRRGRRRPHAGLVYDLAPWDTTATAAVIGVRQDFRTIPIFLIVPSHPLAAELLLQCGALPCVHGVLHSPATAARVREGVEMLLAHAPTKLVSHLLRALFPGIPEHVTTYAMQVVEELEEERDAVRVGRLFDALSITARVAERAFSQAELPSPKRLADWVTMLVIAMAAERGRSTLADAARYYGYNSNEFYRLRQRLLPTDLQTLEARASQAFDLTLLAFADACGVPRERAMAALAEQAGPQAKRA